MYHQLLSPEDKDRHYVDFDFENDEYVLLINNIGGTSSFELYAIAEHALANLPLKKKPKRVYVSDFVTSFNSPGFSITLLNLSNLKKEDISFTDEDVLKFWILQLMLQVGNQKSMIQKFGICKIKKLNRL